MARIDMEEAGGMNVTAFLDCIAFSEIGPALLKVSDDGYNVIVGSTAEHPILFSDYSKHPQTFRVQENSDAAGRYQFMARYWKPYKEQLNLPDFGPLSQDRWAIQLMRECKAIRLIQTDAFEDAVHACRSRWASFPGSAYGQHENQLNDLRGAYIEAGGICR